MAGNTGLTSLAQQDHSAHCGGTHCHVREQAAPVAHHWRRVVAQSTNCG